MRQIRKSKWAGLDNYGCPYCPYSTLQGEDLVQAHILQVHATELRVSEVEDMKATARVAGQEYETPADVAAQKGDSKE